jgi:hypothetical protein
LNKGFVPRDGRSRIIGHLPGVVDVLGFSFCRPAEARWARGTFHKARIAHSGTVLQRVVNPPAGVDLGAALSAKVFVLPVLVEDCEIPVFLREKLYADFRKDFKSGLQALVDAVARVTKIDQGRLKTGNAQIDWSETWGYIEKHFHIDYTYSESSPDWPFTLLTEIAISCDEGATKRYEQYKEQELGWLGRAAITEAVCEFATTNKIQMVLRDQHPQIMKVQIVDPERNISYGVQFRCRRMGQDNGKDQLVHIANYIEKTRDHIRATARKPTQQELERMKSLISNL